MKDTEYFLAVTPIKELFHNKPIRLTNKKINKVGNLESDINKKIGEFISTGKKEIKPTYNINLEDFDSIREYIENEITPDTLAEQSKDIDDQELKDNLMLKSQEMINNTRNLLPVDRHESLFDSYEREPSNIQKNKFIRQMRILEDPTITLELIQSGEITPTEIETLGLFYPNYLQTLQESVISNMVDAKSRDDISFGREKNSVLSTVLQVPKITPEVILENQKMYAQDEQQEKTEVTVKPESTMTNTQRVALT